MIAIGSCASFGGPYAADPNPSRSLPVHKVLKDIQVINVPGCPAHPDWFVGTLSHVILYGMPNLDAYGRPRMFYEHTLHDFAPGANTLKTAFMQNTLEMRAACFK